MRKFFNSLAIFLLLIGFSGCFGEDEKVKAPKKDHIFVKNDGVEDFKVDVQNRVKEKVLVPFRETIKIEFKLNKIENYWRITQISNLEDILRQNMDQVEELIDLDT